MGFLFCLFASLLYLLLLSKSSSPAAEKFLVSFYKSLVIVVKFAALVKIFEKIPLLLFLANIAYRYLLKKVFATAACK